MIFLHGLYDNKEITIIIEDYWKPCLMSIDLLHPFKSRQKDVLYANAVKLSADLACELGYGPAAAFLHAHNISEDSPLWFLNHEGYSPPLPNCPFDITVLPA